MTIELSYDSLSNDMTYDMTYDLTYDLCSYVVCA